MIKIFKKSHIITGVKFEILSDKHITLVVRGSTMYNDNKVFRATDNKWHYPKTEDIENSRFVIMFIYFIHLYIIG